MRSFVFVLVYCFALLFVSPALAATVPVELNSSEIGAHKVTASLVAQAVATRPLEVTIEAPLATPPEELDPVAVAKLIVDALGSKNWALLGCAGVLAAVYLARRFGAAFWPWLRTDAGGVALSFASAVLLALVSALSTGTSFSLSLLIGAVLTAASASGFWTWGRKLLPGLASMLMKK